MLYRTVMAVGVLAMAWSGTWFYRILAGTEHLHRADVPAMIGGGLAGGLAALYFVPWLLRREAARRRPK